MSLTEPYWVIDVLHIFSHSGSDGIYGTPWNLGILLGTVDPQSRQAGARVVTDIPTASFSQSIIVILHGCNTASGSNNFAKALFRHLASAYPRGNPRVYGHFDGGCCGRNINWRRYSARSPNGQDLSSLSPFYEGNGCCVPLAERLCRR